MKRRLAFTFVLAAASRAGLPPAASAAWKNPLDQIITVRQSSGTLSSFFDAVSLQTRLEFTLVGLDDCTAGAFLWNRPTREVLQLALEGARLTYQRLGRSNHYTVSLRANDKVGCRRLSPAPEGQGSCLISGDTPISVECKGAPLHSFAQTLFSQSDANFFLWNGAESHPVSIRLEGANEDSAMKGILGDDGLVVKQIGPGKIYAIGLREK